MPARAKRLGFRLLDEVEMRCAQDLCSWPRCLVGLQGWRVQGAGFVCRGFRCGGEGGCWRAIRQGRGVL